MCVGGAGLGGLWERAGKAWEAMQSSVWRSDGAGPKGESGPRVERKGCRGRVGWWAGGLGSDLLAGISVQITAPLHFCYIGYWLNPTTLGGEERAGSPPLLEGRNQNQPDHLPTPS